MTDIIMDLIAKDDYSAVIKGAKDATNQLADAEKAHSIETAKSSSAGKVMVQTLTDVKAGFDLVSQAAQIGGQIYNALVGDTIKYAGAVKDLALNLSLSSEETSKILSLGQKFGVSNETITNSLQMMVKRGMAPSLDGLAKLSDQMMSIQDPVKRSAALTEIFGRNWTALMPILEKGSTGIRNAASEAEKLGLVLGQKDVDAVENLEIASNSLGMKLDGIKTKIGTALIPVLNDAADGLTRIVDTMSPATTKAQEYEQAITLLSMRFGANSEQVNRAAQEYQNYLIAQKNAVEMTDAADRAMANSTADAAAAAQQLADAQNAVMTGAYGLTGALDESARAAQRQKEALATEDIYKAATAIKSLTTETIYNQAAAGLDAEAAYKLGEAMGLIPKGADEAIKALEAQKKQYQETGDLDLYIAKTQRLSEAIQALESKNIEITQTTIIREEYQQNRSRLGQDNSLTGGHATGVNMIIPPGYNENYPLGNMGYGSSGERVSVTPVNQQTNQIGSVTINIGAISREYTPQQAGEDIVNRMRNRGLVA